MHEQRRSRAPARTARTASIVAEVERRHDDRRRRDRARGRPRRARRACSGSASGSHGQTLDLDVHEPARARLERLRERRAPTGSAARISANGCAASRPTVRRLGVVVDDQHAVGAAAHVELDAVGTELTGAREGLDRVLRRPAARAAVGEHERSRIADIGAGYARCRNRQHVPLLRANVLVRTLARRLRAPLPCASRCRIRSTFEDGLACDRAHKTTTGLCDPEGGTKWR